MSAHIIAVTNQKGGVGKTTTTINLAQALALRGASVLVVDTDPQGNTTQGFGVPLEAICKSVSDLILNRELPADAATYAGDGISLIPATHRLAEVEREMVGMTNSELRLARTLKAVRGKYSVILLDVPPTFGPLMNSALNAADSLIIPVDSGFYAMNGIKDMLAEIEEIKVGTNPDLRILGILLTLADQTRMAGDVFDELVASFGDKVFATKIRRNVKLKEAPALGKTIFHHAPTSTGAQDYLALADEIRTQLELPQNEVAKFEQPQIAPAIPRVAGGVQ
ncbi:MAG: ParA family protein [Bdellovibrionaceae bacterium]|nr:ParA family protein [Bdellovibrionales bacterium]MCB9254148.1 ParA family protein [Pseudobdellovibrionaceae bacterium]